MTFDTIVRDGRWFDGTGAAASIRNIGIRDGHVVAISSDQLDETGCAQVIDASGKWVLPGFVDIHTHYDVEVLNGPGLPESVRHGVTTVLLGSCSLSTVHVDSVDAGDLFGRVEAIPRQHVIDAVEGAKTWKTAGEYVDALESRPLGPNIAAFLGHSDMRSATMGLDRATRKDIRPSADEQAEMERMLIEALEAGFVGCHRNSFFLTRSMAKTAGPGHYPRLSLSRASCAGSSRYCGDVAGCCNRGPTSRIHSMWHRKWPSRFRFCAES